MEEHRRRLAERELSDLQRAFEAGNEGALHEAASLCRRFGTVPRWVMEALIVRQVDHMNRLSHGKGRHARWMTAYRQDQIDHARWDAVVEAKERKTELGLVWTDGRIYEAIAAVLKGTPSEGTPREVEESYLRVRRRIEAEPWRYKKLGYLPVR